MALDQHVPALRVCLLLACAALSRSPATLAAQNPPATQLPVGVTEAQVLDGLRQSGLTRAEVRVRLGQMSYDPQLADLYFDRLEGRSNQPLQVGDDFVRALQEMSVLQGSTPQMELPTTLLSTPDTFRPDTISGAADPDTIFGAAEPDTILRIFGRSIFSGRTSEFQPVVMGPVDAGYRLGPADELYLVLTGDVELAYTLNVTREGYIIVPDVGQVSVNGLTLDGLRSLLYDRLGRVYSGVRRVGATTFFDLSLGRLRTNQVFVIGDAVLPGAYQVSSAATVFNALYQAGGPSDLGSFRTVVVRRSGAVVAEVDLYDYLIRGDASRDVRLEHGDVVFVPPAGPQVALQGEVRRPAIYEMGKGEGVREALAFAGGPGADAALQRVQIDRILPPSERVPGIDRALLDVNLAELADPSGQVIPLRDGDEVRVFATLAERRNRVALAGSVHRPGLYEYRPGMTVWDLIGRADGLSDEAFRTVAHVIRPLPDSGGRRLLQLSLETDANGRPVGDVELVDRDSVMVYAADSLSAPAYIEIEGLVKNPGKHLFAEGTTVRDLIVAAGGFTEGAEVFEAEVVRPRQEHDRSDTIAVVHTVVLGGDIPAAWARPPSGSSSGLPTGASFELQEGDRIFIRRMSGYVNSITVTVEGEVMRAGPYALQIRNERMSSVMERAGRPTEDAYVPGTRLMRDSVVVAINMELALAQPGGPEDVILEHGDVIIVPLFDPTVLVEGAVAFESRVVYGVDRSMEEYLRQAGGTLEDADLGRISVRYPSGERSSVRKILFFTLDPDVEPGSTIFVPRATPAQSFDWGQLFTRALSITGTITAVVLAIYQITGG